MLRLLCPGKYYDSVCEVDLAELKREGIEGLIIDLDNTLVPRYKRETPQRIRRWLQEAILQGFRICILSNNWTTRASEIASQFKLPLLAPAGKPRQRAFLRAIKMLDVSPEQTVVIGDQIFTDILGGNRLGLKTILVVPISPQEMLHTKFLRRLERLVLKKLRERNLLKNSTE
ncbi:MAG: YqeG family HAD IIIA-type phosphatase [Actinomycetota bacterium]